MNKNGKVMDNLHLKKLIIKALLNEISEEEQKQLSAWLGESRDRQLFFEQLYSNDFLRKAIGDHNRKERKRVWEVISKQIWKNERRYLKIRFLQLASAAAVLLVFGLLFWLVPQETKKEQLVEHPIQVGSSKAIVKLSTGEQLFLSGDTTICMREGKTVLTTQDNTLNLLANSRAEGEDTVFTEIRIPRGGEYCVNLEDGSKVYLNAESELRIPAHFDSKKRVVYLKGEAYFDVQHEKERRFIVKTQRADITVLGTEFGVREYEGEDVLLATLVEGKIEVKNEKGVQYVQPGEQARVDDTKRIEVREVNVEEYVSWRSGRIVFVDARLDKIMEELGRWYNFDVVYEQSSLRDLRFTIDIVKYEEASDIFELMEKLNKLTIEINGKEVILKSKE